MQLSNNVLKFLNNDATYSDVHNIINIVTWVSMVDDIYEMGKLRKKAKEIYRGKGDIMFISPGYNLIKKYRGHITIDIPSYQHAIVQEKINYGFPSENLYSCDDDFYHRNTSILMFLHKNKDTVYQQTQIADAIKISSKSVWRSFWYNIYNYYKDFYSEVLIKYPMSPILCLEYIPNYNNSGIYNNYNEAVKQSEVPSTLWETGDISNQLDLDIWIDNVFCEISAYDVVKPPLKCPYSLGELVNKTSNKENSGCNSQCSEYSGFNPWSSGKYFCDGGEKECKICLNTRSYTFTINILELIKLYVIAKGCVEKDNINEAYRDSIEKKKDTLYPILKAVCEANDTSCGFNELVSTIPIIVYNPITQQPFTSNFLKDMYTKYQDGLTTLSETWQAKIRKMITDKQIFKDLDSVWNGTKWVSKKLSGNVKASSENEIKMINEFLSDPDHIAKLKEKKIDNMTKWEMLTTSLAVGGRLSASIISAVLLVHSAGGSHLMSHSFIKALHTIQSLFKDISKLDKILIDIIIAKNNPKFIKATSLILDTVNDVLSGKVKVNMKNNNKLVTKLQKILKNGNKMTSSELDNIINSGLNKSIIDSYYKSILDLELNNKSIESLESTIFDIIGTTVYNNLQLPGQEDIVDILKQESNNVDITSGLQRIIDKHIKSGFYLLKLKNEMEKNDESTSYMFEPSFNLQLVMTHNKISSCLRFIQDDLSIDLDDQIGITRCGCSDLAVWSVSNTKLLGRKWLGHIKKPALLNKIALDKDTMQVIKHVDKPRYKRKNDDKDDNKCLIAEWGKEYNDCSKYSSVCDATGGLAAKNAEVMRYCCPETCDILTDDEYNIASEIFKNMDSQNKKYLVMENMLIVDPKSRKNMFTILDSNKDKKVIFDEWIAYLKSVKKKKGADFINFLNRKVENTVQNSIKGGGLYQYNYIINPLTNRKVSIHNKLGKTVLNNYIETLRTTDKTSI